MQTSASPQFFYISYRWKIPVRQVPTQSAPPVGEETFGLSPTTVSSWRARRWSWSDYPPQTPGGRHPRCPLPSHSTWNAGAKGQRAQWGKEGNTEGDRIGIRQRKNSRETLKRGRQWKDNKQKQTFFANRRYMWCNLLLGNKVIPTYSNYCKHTRTDSCGRFSHSKRNNLFLHLFKAV